MRFITEIKAEMGEISRQLSLLNQSIQKLTKAIRKNDYDTNSNKHKEHIQYVLMSNGQVFDSLKEARKHEQSLGLANDIITVYPPSMSPQILRNLNEDCTKKSGDEKS